MRHPFFMSFRGPVAHVDRPEEQVCATGVQALTRVAALLLFGKKEKISPEDFGGSFAER